jgi:hypothetical protein
MGAAQEFFLNLISKYVEILQKYKTKANANKIIEMARVKDLVEKGSKSKTNLGTIF